MTHPQIYTDMSVQLAEDMEAMAEHGLGYSPSIHGFLLPLPESVVTYLALRKKALSDSSCRAQDTASTHLTWLTYHQKLSTDCEAVDGIAWELVYQELASTHNLSVDALNCMEMGLSADPAKAYIHVTGVKPMLTGSTKTTPDFVAYANSHAEDYEWDLTQLYPPALALSMNEVNQFDEFIKSTMDALGVEGEAPSFLDVMMDVGVGDDVSLA